MEEKDIVLLQGLGYTVSGGAIVDSDGKYHDSIEYNGRVIHSWLGKEEYEKNVLRHEMLDEIGFKEDPNSVDNLRTQQEIALAKHHIKSYEKDSLSVNPPNLNDPFYKSAYQELQELKKEAVIEIEPQSYKKIDTSSSFNYIIPILGIAIIVTFVAIIIRYKIMKETIIKNTKVKYYWISIFISAIISVLVGFVFKKYNRLDILYRASKKKTEWQKDAFLEYSKANDSLFNLSDYNYNWQWFTISFILILSLFIIIRNTIYYDKIKVFFKSIKK